MGEKKTSGPLWGRGRPCIAAVSAAWGEAGQSAVLWRAMCEQRGLLLPSTEDEQDSDAHVDFVAWRDFLRMSRALNSCEGWLGERALNMPSTKHMMKLAEDRGSFWKALTTCLEPCLEASEAERTQSWWQKGRCGKVLPVSGPVVSPLHECNFVYSGALAFGLPSVTEDDQFWLVLSSSFKDDTQLHLFVPIRDGCAIAELEMDVPLGRLELRVDFAEGEDVVGILRDVWAVASAGAQPSTCLVALSAIAGDAAGTMACSGFIPWKPGLPRVRLHSVV